MTITLPLQPGEESKLIALAQAKAFKKGLCKLYLRRQPA
jgi:hypothetical protein